MDSGYEAVPVDGNIATTNGINGTHEEVPEMKTRSKVAVGGGGDALDDESAKPKVRLTRTTMAQKSGVADDKDGGSDSDKKDKKKNLRSAGDAEDASREPKEAAVASIANSSSTAGSAKTATSNTTGAVSAKMVTNSITGAVGISARKAKPGDEEQSLKAASSSAAAAAPTPSAASKRKALERDDDSGINSRASSVSNDEVATPARMRTRSSRTSEIASTSTPAYKRAGAARVPLSIYEYDAASFDDDLLPPIGNASASKAFGASAQKRKAVVYVEEMEDDDDEEPEEEGVGDGGEPAAKRRAAFLVSAGTGIVTALLYPWRKLRSGIVAIRPYKATAAVASAEHGEQENGVDSAVADESMETSSVAGNETVAQSSGDQQESGETANTCSLM